MQLEELGLTKKQIEILQKRKVVSAESLLRRMPLHYWDFSRTMLLDPEEPDTEMALSRNMPFAVIGTCVSCKTEKKDHTMLLKLQIEDEEPRSSAKKKCLLHVNVLGMDALKYRLLEEEENHPACLMAAIPGNIPPICETVAEVNEKCRKAIAVLNEEPAPTVSAVGSLRTHGMDGCSRMTVPELVVTCGQPVYDFLLKFFHESKKYPKHAAPCLKWYARGLRLDLCIRKVLTDDCQLSTLLLKQRVIVGGFITYNPQYGSFSILNPPVLSKRIEKYHTYYTQYGQTKGFTQEEYASVIDRALESISSFDIMPPDLLRKLALPSFQESVRMIHHPAGWNDVVAGRKRATFDDLMYLAVKLRLNQTESGGNCEKMPASEVMDRYIRSLPYSLTDGQSDAIRTISGRMEEGRSVRSLVQGDVGTGKTCVAFALLLKAAENGYQAAMAAPYTTLAWQHFRDMEKTAAEYGIRIEFLTSETKVSEKKKAYERIKNGTSSIIIGTHSIFSDAVEYKNLGLIVIDEEHKFGVVHRGSFIDKGIPGCHQVTMSATPIPKSLADTLYGDSTTIISITDKPAERLPVKTAITSSDAAAAKHMIKEVKAGHQAYIVCPAIEKNGTGERNISIEDKERIYRGFFKPEGVSMAVLTGKMKAAQKTELMNAFAERKIDVLMATTVIEVGMNVPNATVMTITGADRFGFSTLHQLRGRVGRGKDQAYCILQTEAPNEKLDFMKTTNDGFAIAEKDLELRGPGSLFGERQSGDNYFVSLMLAYPNMFKRIRKEAEILCRNQTGKDIVRRYEELFLAEEQR